MHRECRERFPRHRLQRKPLVSDPVMHHGTCVTHVSCLKSGSLTHSGGENATPAFPAHVQPTILRICQEAHGMFYLTSSSHMTVSVPITHVYKGRLKCSFTPTLTYWDWIIPVQHSQYHECSQIAKFMGPTWGHHGSCRPQMGPVLAPWTLLSGLMPWLLASPGHQHPWYWLCRIGYFLAYMSKDLNYLCNVIVEDWYKS